MAKQKMSEETRALVVERDHGMCVVCGDPLPENWPGFSVHHRKPRSSAEPNLNSPANLAAICGSGTTGCHGWVHAHPEQSYEFGFLVPRGMDPAKWAIEHASHGAVYLLDDGSWMPVPIEPEAS